MSLSEKSLCTRQSLKKDFERLGVGTGSTVLIHASLSSLGYVVGGAETVISALLDVVGDPGTLIVPTQSSHNSDPAHWSQPPVPESWWSTIRKEQPAYDPRTTPMFGMGKVAELLHTWPGSVRSDHPQTSFTALGHQAQYITSNHALDSALGENSPLAKLEKLQAQILLLGTGFDKCTAFHLAEYRLPRPMMDCSFAVMTEKGRAWVTVQDSDLDESCFTELGQAYEASYSDHIKQSKIGDAQCRLFSLPDAVKFAESWMRIKEHNE